MKLNFDWAAKRWDDPLTGTEVVCISPNVELHFRNSYFRCTMFTRDGTKMALMSHDPDEQTPSAIWCIDLLTGENEAAGIDVGRIGSVRRAQVLRRDQQSRRRAGKRSPSEQGAAVNPAQYGLPGRVREKTPDPCPFGH